MSDLLSTIENEYFIYCRKAEDLLNQIDMMSLNQRDVNIKEVAVQINEADLCVDIMQWLLDETNGDRNWRHEHHVQVGIEIKSIPTVLYVYISCVPKNRILNNYESVIVRPALSTKIRWTRRACMAEWMRIKEGSSWGRRSPMSRWCSRIWSYRMLNSRGTA